MLTSDTDSLLEHTLGAIVAGKALLLGELPSGVCGRPLWSPSEERCTGWVCFTPARAGVGSD